MNSKREKMTLRNLSDKEIKTINGGVVPWKPFIPLLIPVIEKAIEYMESGAKYVYEKTVGAFSN